MKKILGVLTVLALACVVALGGCQKKKSEAEGGAAKGAVKIGVSMPTQSLQRWNQDGSNMKAQLEKAGYNVDLQFANNSRDTQISQIENMIAGKVKVLVIAAIDGGSLTETLKAAKENKIPVIAYDRLIMNSDAVSYYATFDNSKVGKLQGQFIADKLNLANAPGPFNIEITTGAPDDNNVVFFFGDAAKGLGAMSVLQPYIDSGKVVVLSNQKTIAQCGTPNWSTEESQKRFENLIQTYKYRPGQTKLDAVLCSNDSTANGVTNALKDAGFTKDNFPIVTGQDCDKPSVKNMVAGTQAMSVFKDTRTLAQKVVAMVDALVKGSQPEINDTSTYNNGTGIIPSYLCDPVVVTTANYKEMLLDSGYYKAEDVQ